MTLPLGELVQEKIEALFARKKPRDFFDLYFLLRERLAIAAIVPHKTPLIDIVRSQDAKKIRGELKLFLPVSHQQIISRLPQLLSEELKRL